MGKAKPVPISLPADLLALAETRADSLGLSRSGYVQQLIRADNGKSNMLDTVEQATQKPTKPRAAKKK